MLTHIWTPNLILSRSNYRSSCMCEFDRGFTTCGIRNWRF